MEYLISGLTITATMGTVSAITSLVNSLYTLRDRIVKTSDTGVKDIQNLIESKDLINRIKIMEMFVRKISSNDNVPDDIEMVIGYILGSDDIIVKLAI